MELGTSGFAVFLTHMETAVMNGETYTGKSRTNIFRGDPIGGVLGVIVVTVNRQAVSPDKVIAAAVAVTVLGADIVAVDRRFKARLVCDIYPVRV